MLTHGMRLSRFAVGAMVLIGLFSIDSRVAHAQALPQGVSQFAVPSWVDPIEPGFDAVVDPKNASSPVEYVLVDQQVRVTTADQVDYRHIALRALNTQGLEQAGNLQIDFDPGYQKLVLHRLQVRRSGKIVPQFGHAQMRLLQRELGLENLVIEGTQTLHIVLNDVRVGDIIEYSYSRLGQNPALKGRLNGQFTLQSSVPIQRLRARLVWPRGRALHWRYHNQAEKGKLTQGSTEEDYRWDIAPVPARRVESDAPAWWNPYPWLQWGEHGHWQSVASWAAPLYELRGPTDPEVKKVIARIGGEHTDKEQRAIAAVRWVQTEIRYLAVALGASSYVPTSPGLVIKRRYGDCKDKTLLALSLLHGLGIEARAALVNTKLRRSVDEYLPGPAAFNHVVLRVQVGGGTYWLDPTRMPQAGQRLADWVQADFQRGLVVDRETTALEAIPENRETTRRFHALIDTSAGLDNPALLTVTSEFAGDSAETVRAALAARGRDELEKHALNFYARHYPNLVIQTPIEVLDDLATNRLRMVEHYTLKGLWQWSETRRRHETTIGSPDIEEHLRTPSSTTRDSPLGLRHPHTVEAVTEVRLPEDWRISGNGFEVRDTSFEVRREESLQGRTVTWIDRYRSLKDHVPPSEVIAYASNLERARQGLYITLSKTPKTASTGPHWTPLTVALIAIFGLAWAARRLYLWDPVPKPVFATPDRPVPVGIGGWLLLPLLGLPFQTIAYAKGLYDSWPTFEADTWKALVDSNTIAHPEWAVLLLLSTLVVLLTGLMVSVLCLMLAFLLRSSFPRIYIFGGILNIALMLITLAMLTVLPEADQADARKELATVFSGAIGTLIWIAYMARSRRVCATYVERLAPRPNSLAIEKLPGVDPGKIG